MNAPHSSADLALGPKALRGLWMRMTAMFGHIWASAYGVAPTDDAGDLTLAGDTWARALAGMTSAQLGAGLNACLVAGLEFAPSAPRFRAMCLGIPSLGAVRAELRPGAGQGPQNAHAAPSPFARAIWCQLDAFRYRQASADQADKLLRDAYEVICERTMRGVPLPDPPAAGIEQEALKPTPATEEQARRQMANIQELLHGCHS